MSDKPLLWPGQKPGVHDHKPQDECYAECPGRLDKDADVGFRPPRSRDGVWETEYAVLEVTSQKLMGMPTTVYSTREYAENGMKFHETRREEMQVEADAEARAEKEWERQRRSTGSAGKKLPAHPGNDRRRYYSVVKDHQYVVVQRSVTEWMRV